MVYHWSKFSPWLKIFLAPGFLLNDQQKAECSHGTLWPPVSNWPVKVSVKLTRTSLAHFRVKNFWKGLKPFGDIWLVFTWHSNIHCLGSFMSRTRHLLKADSDFIFTTVHLCIFLPKHRRTPQTNKSLKTTQNIPLPKSIWQLQDVLKFADLCCFKLILFLLCIVILLIAFLTWFYSHYYSLVTLVMCSGCPTCTVSWD